jgi:hypothetical protein
VPAVTPPPPHVPSVAPRKGYAIPGRSSTVSASLVTPITVARRWGTIFMDFLKKMKPTTPRAPSTATGKNNRPRPANAGSTTDPRAPLSRATRTVTKAPITPTATSP